MNPELLDKVLSCKKLPSLPAVALRVIELSQDKNVSFKDLAETITNDIGLASKVLRTVNSSFYSLRKPCGSINQAIVMLGLSAVKTLALGFSLVDNISKIQEGGFDLQGYWRRTLISGIAAKCIAAEAKIGNDEECFLGGLLQDVGVVAFLMALGEEYTTVVAETKGDHSQLAKQELATFGLSHAEIGSQLATRWKLPAELIMPIRYHERPTASPPEHLPIVQAVALGNIAAEVIGSSEPAVALKRFYQRAEQWFRLNEGQSDEIIRRAGESVKEISRLLSVDVGTVQSADELMNKAHEQLAGMAIPFAPSPHGQADYDAVTGLLGRSGLNQNLVAGFEAALPTGRPLSFAFVHLDQGEELLAQGQPVLDAALQIVVQVLKGALPGPDWILARFDEQLFAVLAVNTDRVAATEALEAMRSALASEVRAIVAPGLMPIPTRLSVSAGLATLDAATKDRIREPDELIGLARKALDAALKTGQNAMRVYAPRAAAA